MTNVTFISGLKEIGGTFVRVETDGAVCLFDFGFAVAARIDPAVRLRAESLAADYARRGVRPPAPRLGGRRIETAGPLVLSVTKEQR